MGFSPLSPSNFLQGHPQTLPYYLHSLSSCSLLSSSISTLSQPQSLLIGPCSFPGPLSSPGGTSQFLSTPPQVLGVPF